MPAASGGIMIRNDRRNAGIEFRHAAAFWVGSVAAMVGVLLHFPMFLSARDMGYRLVGMPATPEMLVGMGLILAGTAMATYGLFPRAVTGASHGVERAAALRAGFRAMDDATLTRAHWGLLLVLGVALIIDVMKPATLGFVIPGARAEYGLTTAQVAWLPLIALTGTTLGSFLWGIMADRIGRRASILLASLLFMSTSVCGFMPTFGWNLFMCFMMGISAGGMLPIVYALMSEAVPARRRGWLVVLHAGLGSVGGYLAASGAATLLEPVFTWRILWVLGLPTGAILLLLNRWIPESPRFLLFRGREAEARGVMARFGVTLVPDVSEASPPAHAGVASVLDLFRSDYFGRTLTVGLYAVSWGLVNWGFLTFLPAILRGMGYPGVNASRLLFQSALLALPGTLVVAWLYGFWSSKKSMVLYASITAATLMGFGLLRLGGVGHSLLLTLLSGALLVSTNGVISMISPYTAEIYPTYLRGTGSGFAAGSSKFGGIIGPVLTGSVLAWAGVGTIALAVAVPMALSAVMMTVVGMETRGQRLKELATEPAEARLT